MDRDIAYPLYEERSNFLTALERINREQRLGYRITNGVHNSVIYMGRSLEYVGVVNSTHLVVRTSSPRHNETKNRGIENLLKIGDAYPDLPTDLRGKPRRGLFRRRQHSTTDRFRTADGYRQPREFREQE